MPGKNEYKTKAELLAELAALEQRIMELEAAEARHNRLDRPPYDQEAHFRTIIEQIHLGVILQEPNTEVLFSNQAALEMLGLTKTQLFAHPPFYPDWDVIHEDGAPFPGETQPVPQAIANRKPVRDVVMGVYRPMMRDRVWLMVSAEPRLNPDGSIKDVVCSLSDISALKRAHQALRQQNRELALLNRATQAFIATLELEAVLLNVLEEVRSLLNVAAGTAWLVDPESHELVCWQTTDLNREIIRRWRLAWGQGVVGWSAQRRQSVVVSDTRTDERHFKGVDRQTGVEMRSILCVPLLSQQEVMGVLQMVDTSVDRFKASDLELVELLATTATIAIENASLFQALLESEKRYRRLFENTPIPLCEEDFSQVTTYFEQLRQTGVNDIRSYLEQHPEAVGLCVDLIHIVDVNEAMLKVYQATDKGVFLGKLGQICSPESLTTFKEELIAVAEGQTQFVAEVTHYTLTGRKIYVDLSWSVAPGYEKTYQKVIVSLRDITERKKLEQQLHQAQKMEAVGHLAGGIAHNFNNMLTAIMGHADLALQALPDDYPIAYDLHGIQKTAERAAELTRQLLTFTRRQEPHLKPVNLNELIRGLDPLLRQITKTEIQLILQLEPQLGLVSTDANQFEQALVNLVINARDAMPDGGILLIKTANITLDQAYARQNLDVTPGNYVLLSVKDTGIGMTEEVMAHIFEPFFTTKEVGKGTGLGLATCFGIVKQSQGHISVSSQPGQGATFTIYLPRIATRADDKPIG
jgi:PAS domain S-box-containing protein